MTGAGCIPSPNRLTSTLTNGWGNGVDADAIVVGAGLAGLVAAAELADAGRRVIILDQEPRRLRSAGRRSGRSADCSSSIRPEQRRLGIRDPAISRCRIGSAPPASTATKIIGRAAGPRPMSISRRARNAPGCAAGPADFPGRRLGRARRLSRDRSRQFGAALSRHLGHRARRARAVHRRVREAESRGLVTFRFRHRVTALTMTGGVGRRRAGRRARAEQRGSAAQQARAGGRRVRAARAGGHRHVGRHRRQPRTGAPPLAEAAGRAAAPHDLGRAGARRRADARCRAGRAARGSSTPIACGTTRKASRTTRRSGAAMASAS